MSTEAANSSIALPAGAKIVGPNLIEMPEPLGIFAGALFERANQYLSAFERLQGQDPHADMYACYFLFSHALELYLKSYLAAQGISKKALRQQKVRHNLIELYSHADTLGFPHIPDLKEMVTGIQQMNDDYDFRYPSGYNLHVPTARLCMGVAEPLRHTLSRIVGSARVKAQIDWASETRHLKPFKIKWSD
ncbi:UNVERIFIED_ORG: HEPN domain-containing protein [Rhizobium aethiopicum]